MDILLLLLSNGAAAGDSLSRFAFQMVIEMSFWYVAELMLIKKVRACACERICNNWNLLFHSTYFKKCDRTFFVIQSILYLHIICAIKKRNAFSFECYFTLITNVQKKFLQKFHIDGDVDFGRASGPHNFFSMWWSLYQYDWTLNKKKLN